MGPDGSTLCIVCIKDEAELIDVDSVKGQGANGSFIKPNTVAIYFGWMSEPASPIVRSQISTLPPSSVVVGYSFPSGLCALISVVQRSLYSE